MAQKIIVLNSCDLSHNGDAPVTEGVTTIQFGYEGRTYSVELCPDHLEEYHNWMQDYIHHGARPESGGRRAASTPSGGRPRRAGKNELGDIRTWARENGYTVSERGRISADVQKAYAEAH